MFIFSWLERLAAGVFVMVFLIVGAWLMQAFGIPPDAVSNFFANKILYDVAVFGSLLPYLAALVFLAGFIFVLAHHQGYAILSGVFTIVLVVLSFAWYLGFHTWVAQHLAGAA